MLLESSDYREIIEGSFEQSISIIQNALESEIEEDIGILATFKNKVIYSYGDHVYEAKYSIKDGRIKIQSSIMENIVCYNESNSRRTVSTLLGGFFNDNHDDEETRNRLRVFSELVSIDEHYSISLPLSILATIVENDTAWLVYYKENEQHVRKGLFGHLKEIRSEVPGKLRPVAKNSVNEDSVIVVEKTLDIIIGVVQNIVDKPLDADDDDDEGLGEVRSSLSIDADKCLKSLMEVRDLVAVGNVIDVISVVNSMNEFFRTMLTVSSFFNNGKNKE